MRTMVVPNTGSTNGLCSAGRGTTGAGRSSCPEALAARAGAVQQAPHRVVAAAVTASETRAVVAAIAVQMRFVVLLIAPPLYVVGEPRLACASP